EGLVRRNVAARRLSFSKEIARAVPGAEVIFLAVGTPSAHDGSSDLSRVVAAAPETGRALTGYAAVVTTSPVTVGTADKVKAAIAAVTSQPFSVASNPEFLKEGDAVNDFMKPERIIIGAEDERAIQVLRHLYGPFVRTNDRILEMDPRSAELTKYASN